MPFLEPFFLQNIFKTRRESLYLRGFTLQKKILLLMSGIIK